MSSLHGQAKRKDKSDRIIVDGTHEAIIPRDQWDRVQKILNSNAKTLDFESNVSPFAGFLKARFEPERKTAASGAYADCKDAILSKEDYLRYRQDYKTHEKKSNEQLERMDAVDKALLEA